MSNIEDIAHECNIGHFVHAGGGEFDWVLTDNEHQFATLLVNRCIEVIAGDVSNPLSAETAYRQICQEEIHKYFFKELP